MILLIVLSPVILIIAFLLLYANEGKPFFYQDRGYKERKICIMKFKSMNDQKDSEGKLLPDNERITAMRKFIRYTSMDELPQLLNVLKGDMSFIGPRPLLFKYLPLYSDTQRRRHEVKPGVTGLAQANGRNAISWAKKFEYDVNYMDYLSFGLDFQILLKTIQKSYLEKG